MSLLPPPIIYHHPSSSSSSHSSSSSAHLHPTTLIPHLISLHISCIQHDHMLASILDTSSPEKFQAYWEARFREVEAGTRVMFLQFASSSSSSKQQDEVKEGAGGEELELELELELEQELAGVVMLDMSISTETGPFRCAVEKLMTSPRHRKKGIAKALMYKLEEEARIREKYLLMLDTEVGSGADLVYTKLGYTTVGVIPKFGISPKDGRLIDEILFYKDLRDEKI